MQTEQGFQASKKIKLSPDISTDNRDYDKEITRYEAVLADELTSNVCSEYALACPVLNKKYVSKLIKDLAVHLPATRLQHLKRVKNDKSNAGNQLSILLCTLDAIPSSTTEGCLPPLRELCPTLDLPTGAVGDTFMVLVPVSAPRTRPQYNKASAMWPITFHEDKYISGMLSGDIPTSDELKKANIFMKSALEMAAAGQQSHQVVSGCCEGCVIVDPATNRLLAAAHPVTRQHPLHHAVMVAIDLVARQHGGGAYKYHDSKVYVSDVEESLGVNSASSDKSGDKSGVSRDKSVPYLCTGYEVYATHEPCVMCSMALVHSRIARLYYRQSTPDGAVGTKYKIHVQPGLNHHFEAFRGCQPHNDKISKTFSDIGENMDNIS